jgi:4-amino-4-deoxy-L-arabinose transferase-like glycosyltransferase
MSFSKTENASGNLPFLGGSSNTLPVWNDEARQADRLAAVILALLIASFIFFVTRGITSLPAPLPAEALLLRKASPISPLLDWSLRAVAGIFGVGITQARWFSLTMASLSLVAVYSIGRKLHSRAAGLFACFALVFDANFFQTARTLRPETPAVAFAMFGFYLYMRSQATEHKVRKWIWGVGGGVLAFGAGMYDPCGWYVLAAALLWAVVQRGDVLRSVSWWCFVIGASAIGLPYGFYVWRHFAEITGAWQADGWILYPFQSGSILGNLMAERYRYAQWRTGLLLLPTPDSLAVQMFQVLTGSALLYLTIRTVRTTYRMVSHWRLVTAIRRQFGGMPAPHQLEELYESGEVTLPKTGTLESWMFEKGGIFRRVSLIVQEIEKDTRPITHWIDALGAPSHPDWRVPRTGLLLAVLAAVAIPALFDGHKSGAGMTFLTTWFALCVGVLLTDGFRWAVAQRRRSTRRVLRGLGLLFVVLTVCFISFGSSSRAVWRFYRWTRTFDPAPYSELSNTLLKVLPPNVRVVAGDVHWLTFHDRAPFSTFSEEARRPVSTEPTVYIFDRSIPASKRPELANAKLIAEMTNTLYGKVEVYYRGDDQAVLERATERFYFTADPDRGFGRAGYYSERQRQEATVVWLAGPAELERLARVQGQGGRPPQMQRDGNRVALRIVTDVSSSNTSIRLPMPPLKPNTMYRLQTALRVTEGGGLIGPRDRTGLWLADPVACGTSEQYVPIDIVFTTNARGDGELAVGNRRNQPAASLMYLSQVELREIGPKP